MIPLPGQLVVARPGVDFVYLLDGPVIDHDRSCGAGRLYAEDVAVVVAWNTTKVMLAAPGGALGWVQAYEVRSVGPRVACVDSDPSGDRAPGDDRTGGG